MFADNGRAPSVGSFRRGIRISEGNLLGLGDSLSLEYTNTDGSNAYDARYTVPVNPRNGTVTLSAGLTGIMGHHRMGHHRIGLIIVAFAETLWHL